jgi:hypothetical protein
VINLHRAHGIEDALSRRRNDKVNDLGQVPGHITEVSDFGHSDVEARLAQRVEEVQTLRTLSVPRQMLYLVSTRPARRGDGQADIGGPHTFSHSSIMQSQRSSPHRELYFMAKATTFCIDC